MRSATIPTLLLGLVLALLPALPASAQSPTGPRAHKCDGDVCVFLSLLSPDATVLSVVIEGPPDAKWLGIGFATTMASGDSYIGMMSAQNTPIVSRRRLVGRRSPEVFPQADQHANPPTNSSFGKVDAVNKFVVQFRRPRTGVDIARPVNVIFAYSVRPVPNPGPTAALPKHEAYGQLTLDLSDGTQQAAHDAAITRNRELVQKAKNGGAASTTPTADPADGETVKADAEQGKGALIPAAPGGSGPGAGSGAKVGVSVESWVVMGVAVGSAAIALLMG